MAFAQGSRSQLSFIKETAFGTTPTTPTFIELPIKTHSLSLSKERLQGEDILADRMPRVDRHGTRQAGGSIEVDFRTTAYDAFLESAMFDTFAGGTADELKVGVAPQFLSIEDGALDIDQYRLYTGMAVNTASFSAQAGQMINTTFEMVGKDMVQSATTAADSLTSATNFNPADTFSGEIFEGGTTSSDAIGIVSSINFNITNSLAAVFALGDAAAAQLEFGRAVVEGEITVYYENADLITKFLDETETSLRVTFDDPSGLNAYTFDFPRVKLNSGDAPLANPQSRLVTHSFSALFDTTAESNLVITKG